MQSFKQALRRGITSESPIEAFRHYFGKSISIGLPLTYRFVFIRVSDKFAYSDPEQKSFLRASTTKKPLIP